jgi:hypothetical protein
MAVDLQAIEARIRKLTKLRDILSDKDTMELMADPEVMKAFLESVGTRSNGGSNHAVKGGADDVTLFGDAVHDRNMPGEGTLRNAVYREGLVLGSPFVAKTIVKRLEASGFKFGTSDHMIAVNQALRSLHRKKLVKMVERGSGRRGNLYEAVKGEAHS